MSVESGLRSIIAERKLRTVFQPIIALQDGAVMGFESLNRGPADSPFADARRLFDAAHATGMLPALDRACWTSSLERAAALFQGRKGFTNLFINVMPEEIRQPQFLEFALEAARKAGILPNQIVVEVTEGSRIDDYPFFATVLAGYRAAGLRIAVDDAGAGHSGLQTIVELNPDFVKIDRTLVAGVDRSAGKRAAVEALALVGRRLGLGLVAEGVETVDELMEVRRLGIPYAQGYLIAPPEDVPQEPGEKVRALLIPGVPIPVERQRRAPGLFLGDIVAGTPTVQSGIRVETVFERFERERGDGFVVLSGSAPVGLVMRTALYRLLSQRYGHELYLRRTVDEIASHPLVVDARAPLEEVSRMATERHEDSFHDHIVVVRDGAYLGTVSVQRLLEAITNLQLVSARMENPLTGLPGNPAIHEELGRRLEAGQSFSLVYADLDHFKAFNDHYGFHHGDRAIKLTAQVLTRVVSELGGGDGFVGHIGGDDFFGIVAPAAEVLVMNETRVEFERLSWQLYGEAERAEGGYHVVDRHGASQRHPLLSITVATLPVAGGGAGGEASDVLAALTASKNRAKAARLR